MKIKSKAGAESTTKTTYGISRSKVKDFIQNIVNETKHYIEKYEEYKSLSGEEKKARVDNILKNYIETAIDTVGLNFIVKFIVKKILIENISTITQCIFDLLKLKKESLINEC